MLRPMTAMLTLALSSVGLADDVTVEVYATSFEPDEIDVQPGDTVTWTYISGYPHTITSGTPCTADGIWFDEQINSGSPTVTWTVPDSAAGMEIDYFCTPHCAMGMTGAINVAGAESGTYAVRMFDCTGSLEWSATSDGGSSWQWGGSSSADSQIFQLALEVWGSLEIEVLSATGMSCYTVGGSTSGISTGTMTLTSGYHVITSASASYASIGFQLPGGSPAGPSSAPLWDEISIHGSAHWEDRDGRVHYEFTGDYPGLHQFIGVLNAASEGTADMFWYGSLGSVGITLSSEAEEGSVVVPAGTSELMDAGTGMFHLRIALGDPPADPCPSDIDGDGTVGINDLLELIGAWGPCM
ncbi:MAG: plastocyanin/azurin family copper-binding protein [Phycisphaerales bacterium]|nr:plastocyanin/azurin family copper-binding protein [Phycisphaerales bacterium]